MPASKKPLRATSTFVCEVKGREYRVNAGALYAGDHPALKGREELFESAEVAEQATKAPVKKRKR